MSLNPIPESQHAIQLVGPGELKLNRSKEVFRPGPHQVLARVEAVGLCFSDLKLLKQFSAHARKSDIITGIPDEVLRQIPSYVPNQRPTVPGHEVVCRIIAVGDEVKHHRVGDRCLVQTDYRTLRTSASNAAFGYNFEGGLQEYVLMDERVVMDPETGERFLIPVSEELSASAVALVEPWACVEDSYANPERRSLKHGGRLLVCADDGAIAAGLGPLVQQARPVSAVAVGLKTDFPSESADLASLPDEHFDDIVYFGSTKETVERLNGKLAAGGILNVVMCGGTFGETVSVGVGRVHYGMTRWIGTPGWDPAQPYAGIPETGEIRAGDRIVVYGAGGPMGQMHIIRCICQGVPDIQIVGTDVDDGRLAALEAKAGPLARAAGVDLQLVNTTRDAVEGTFDYSAVLAPSGALVAESITRSRPRTIINIFAGIPAPTRQDINLDRYIANGCFMFGTSGSVIRDMKIVLGKVQDGALDTNCSVDAISGMAGATEALAAVENRTLAGKIIVYPMLHDVGLIPLTQLASRFPSVAEKLQDGQWTKAAEDELMRVSPQR